MFGCYLCVTGLLLDLWVLLINIAGLLGYLMLDGVHYVCKVSFGILGLVVYVFVWYWCCLFFCSFVWVLFAVLFVGWLVGWYWLLVGYCVLSFGLLCCCLFVVDYCLVVVGYYSGVVLCYLCVVYCLCVGSVGVMGFVLV